MNNTEIAEIWISLAVIFVTIFYKLQGSIFS
jgi:hypothetical protein